MKTTILITASLAALLSSLPALAGPDWQIIEKAREAKLAQIRAPQAQKAGDPASMAQMCQNMMPTCMEMMKQSCAGMMQSPK
ncbi:hypothetical protein N5B55_24350 (plasmid) [Ralstonia pickettii]|uniref:hypothetical protein n=1 Tax=Ralstonia TaxID=48736 RepID=UPI0027145CF8|nr:hypothetical protein [Ralstonia pickettii]WKZ88713.1 hypothetical protein N5B55_24350 [Ralstonia pickettii]